MPQIILLLDDVRSAHNVGSILRSADGFGINKVIMCGITPYPKQKDDSRLPYLAEKIDKQIAKTSLGAEKNVAWEFISNSSTALQNLISKGYATAALEQTESSVSINNFVVPSKLVLVVGNEVHGVNTELLNICSTHIEIPMKGSKESFNVSVAASVAMYALTNR